MMRNPDRPAFAKVLLEGNCDPNITTIKSKETALHMASKVGCIETVKLMLKYGVDHHKYDMVKRTAMIVAVDAGEKDIVELFTRMGQKLHHRELFEEQHFELMNKTFPTEFCDWFMKETLMTTSLRCIARDVIRVQLDKHRNPEGNIVRFDIKVNQLPLPEQMKDFIMMVP